MESDYEKMMNILHKGTQEGTMSSDWVKAFEALLTDAYHAGAQAGYQEAKREAGLWTSF